MLLSKTGQQVGPILARPYGYAQAWSPDGSKLASDLREAAALIESGSAAAAVLDGRQDGSQIANNWFRADVTGEYRGRANFHGSEVYNINGGSFTDEYSGSKWFVFGFGFTNDFSGRRNGFGGCLV